MSSARSFFFSPFGGKRFATLALVAALGCARKPAAPTAAIAAPATGHVGLPVQLDGSASAPAADLPDPQSLPITFQWSLAAKPGGSSARLEGATGPRPRFLPDLAGAYLVQLVVRDFAGASVPATATVQVSADCAPIVSAAVATPASVNVAQPVALSGSATSPCAAAAGSDPIVAWSWVIAAAPAGSTARIVAPARLDTSFVPDLRGSYDLALQATDALGFQSTLEHVTVTALGCGDNPPTVDSISPSLALPDIGTAVKLQALVSDADAQPPCSLSRSLAYGWSIAAAPAGSRAQLSSRAAQAPSFVPDVAGDYVLALVVTDQLGRASVRKTAIVHASACGGAVPFVTATSSQGSIATGDTVQLLSLVQDPDGPPTPCGSAPATYSWAWQIVAAPLSSTAQLNGTTLMNPSFSADAPGTYVFAVTVTASTGKVSTPALVTVQASACGSVPPSVGIVAVNGAGTGLPVRLTATVDDSANACKPTTPYSFLWTLRGAPAGSAATLSGAPANGASAQAAPSFVPDRSGDYAFQLTVTDALGLSSAAASTIVTVSPCNAPLTAPILAPAGAVTAQPVQLHATPADSNFVPGCPQVTPLISYAWSLVGQPAGSTARLNNGADAAPSFTPLVPGAYTVQLVVQDSAGNLSPPSIATVSVGNCSAPLTVTVPDASGATGQPLLLAASTPFDPNTGCAVTAPFRYQWTLANAPAGSAANLNNPGSAVPSFVPDLAGSYLVSLVVTDAAGNASAPAVGNVAVADCTAAVTASIAPASGVTGRPVALSASVNDPNTGASCAAPVTPYAYAWSLIARPAGSAAALNSVTAASPSFTPDAAGTYSVSLRVVDAAGNRSAPQVSDITVANCRAPIAVSIPPQPGTKTFSTVALSASVTDLQDFGCAVTAPFSYAWSLSSLPAGSSAGLDSPFSPSPRFVPDLPGSYVASLRVTDALGNRGAATAAVVVMGCGQSGGSSMQVRVSASTASPEVGQRTSLSAIVSDLNSAACANKATAPYSYAWSFTVPAGSQATLLNAASAQPGFVPDVAGQYGFTVTVTDALGYQAAPLAAGSVTAASCTLTPSISAVGANQLTWTSVQLVGAGASACGQPFTWAWSFDSLPAGSSAQFNAPSSRTPSFTVDVPNGTWVARLTLTDSITLARTSTTRTVTSGSCGSSKPYATAGISLPFPISVAFPQPNPSVGSTVQYLPNYQLQLDGTLSADPAAACTGPLSFSWSTYSTPPNSAAVLYPVTAARPVFTPDVAGDYIFQLSVSDGRFTSAPSFLHITVSDPLQDAVAGVTRGVLWNDAEPDPSSPTANPSIAYYELNAAGNFYDLRYAQCTGNCASGSPVWALSTIEANAIDVTNTNAATAQVSLKFLPGTGTAAVAYRYDPTCRMRYGILSGGTWNLSTIDALDPGCLGEHGEIQLMFVGAANTPAVAYHTHINGGAPAARYAACTGGCSTGVGTTWAMQDVDTANNAGHYMTAFVSPVTRLPRIAYQDNNTASLHYAECADAAGSCAAATGSWGTPAVLLAGGAGTTPGFWNSMAVAPNGVTGIAFEDGTLNKVRLITCAAGCTSKANWSVQDIATLAAGNYFPSLQYDAQNQAHVTYIDSANKVLRYAIQSNNTFQYFDIDHGVDDGHSSFILTPLGSTHVSYALTTGLKYYPFGD